MIAWIQDNDADVTWSGTIVVRRIDHRLHDHAADIQIPRMSAEEAERQRLLKGFRAVPLNPGKRVPSLKKRGRRR